MYAIFDLDGCLVSESGRTHFLDTSNYDAYHEAAFESEAINLDLLKRFDSDPKITLLFFTGRPTKFRDKTKKQIKETLGVKGSYCLLMRGEGSKRTSPELKRAFLEINEYKPEEIAAAFDNRRDICDMYLDFGIGCVWQVAEDGMVKLKTNEPKPKRSAADCLREGEALFAERNGAYKDSPQRFGRAMAALYPEGLTLNGENDFTKFGIFLQMMSKTTRFAASDNSHLDSIRDLKVYSAMLEAEMEKQQ